MFKKVILCYTIIELIHLSNITILNHFQKKIVELTESLDKAKEEYAKKTGEKCEETKRILSRKLKPKGNKLL